MNISSNKFHIICKSSNKFNQQRQIFGNPFIKPKTFNQERYVNSLTSKKPVVICLGPAGTGKTLLASQIGLNHILDKHFKKIVLTRPVCNVGETHGYLPGDIDQKMSPWIRPLIDSFSEAMRWDEIEQLKRNGSIEIAPLAYMRGRTFNDSYIIADEMQNASLTQLKMLLTRIGYNSKLVITGDIKQCDIEYNYLKDFINYAESKLYLEYIDIIHLNEDDVQRHDAIVEILSIFNEIENMSYK